MRKLLSYHEMIFHPKHAIFTDPPATYHLSPADLDIDLDIIGSQFGNFFALLS